MSKVRALFDQYVKQCRNRRGDDVLVPLRRIEDPQTEIKGSDPRR